MRHKLDKNRILKKHPALRGVFQSCYKINMMGMAFVLCLMLFGCMKQETPVTGTAFMMDTIVEYKLYGSPAAAGAIEEALASFEERCSLYRPNSEITQLNQAAGKEAVALSKDVYDLLRRCVEYGAQSEGSFDVTVAPATALWDINGKNPRVPSEADLQQILSLVNYKDILLYNDGSAMLAKEGQKIDLGGIAKGYACGIARDAAIANGVKSGYVSIGGNIMVIGEKPGGSDYLFGVRDPRGTSNDYVAKITLPDSTMATSGDYERYFEQDGVRYHHILDPATGAPAQTDLLSVSVVSPDGAYADYMSTFLFIKGKSFTLENLNAFDAGLIVIDKDKNIYVSEQLKKNFVFSDTTGIYHYEDTV